MAEDANAMSDEQRLGLQIVDEAFLGVATPGGGWCAPAEVACVCGSTTWPHDCVWDRLQRALNPPAEAAATRVGFLPPCPVCGHADWPAGGMHAARTVHMLAHERRGEVGDG